MFIKRQLLVVDTHTGGEPTRIVTSGLPPIRGNSMLEKRDFFEKNYDEIRTMFMREPRGHKDMFGAILVEPINNTSHWGVIFTSTADYPEGYPLMCGHGIIGIATVLLELGMIQKIEPVTAITLDTPGGIVVAHASIKNGQIIDVSFDSVPAYVIRSNVSIEIPKYGSHNC